MNIKDFLYKYDFAKELPGALTIAQPNITFFGKRVIAITGLEGSLSLDEVALKVLKASAQRCAADNYSPQERLAGLEIMGKLRDFYKVTDTLISKSNWFTRLLNFIREFTFDPYTPRFHTEEVGSMENYFRGFSESRFIKEFGSPVFASKGTGFNSDGTFGPPLRVMALEARIRAQTGMGDGGGAVNSLW